MRNRCLIVSSLLFLFFASLACAEVYVWTDESGTVNFTDNPGTVPQKFRNNVKRLGDESPGLEKNSEEAPEKSPKESLRSAPANAKAENSPSGGGLPGRNDEQWKKELEARETAMTSLKNRIDEIAYRLKNVPARKEEMDRLVAEHKELLGQFNEMKAKYNQEVEKARKEGMQITIQQQ